VAQVSRALLVVFEAIVLGGCTNHRATNAQQSRLALAYWQFDQSTEGWRSLADQQRFREAAILIEDYLPKHPELLLNQRAMLHFHAAQLFGFEGNYEAALQHLRHSAVPADAPGFPIRWNDYVAATRAFLNDDRAGLLAARERMAQAQLTDQDRTYLGVVDLLISRWGEPYGRAYLSQMKERKRSRNSNASLAVHTVE
jgi:hypothetical protein